MEILHIIQYIVFKIKFCHVKSNLLCFDHALDPVADGLVALYCIFVNLSVYIFSYTACHSNEEKIFMKL